MKLLLLAACLCPISTWAQQASLSPIPDCSSGYCSGLGVPVFRCNPGWHFAQMDNPGINYTCTGIPPSWVPDSMVQTPTLSVSKTFTVTPQTIRGIVGAIAGLSTGNAGTYLDIFPLGYNPWLSGITFEDYATNQFTNFNSGAINLGLADNSTNSQAICFTATRAATFDAVNCLNSKGGALVWPASLNLGGSGVSQTQYSFAAQVGYDSTNQNAVLNGGGSATASTVGAALAVANATMGGTYALYCDKNANCGVGPQKTNATLDPFFVTLAGAVTEPSVKVGTGTVLSRYSRYNGAFTPAAVAANTCAAQSFTVTGVVVGDILIGVNKPTEQAGLSVTPGHVTGTNTATMNFCNNTAISITPTAAETYNMVVVQ